ncbi:hypothetical protein [Acidithrix sp. C25]|uniref:hypothetical protein n=1 Tax=Acidithrix sp. C25 TaxID=1671482 RepID=UPI00191BBF28|nr:hypothetical protein [Acidithrix sp. C25]
MIIEIPSGGKRLNVSVVEDSKSKMDNLPPPKALILAYGAPTAPRVSGVEVDFYLDNFQQRLVTSSGCMVAVVNLSGVGGSQGAFSPLTWRQDLVNTVSYFRDEMHVDRVFMVGFELATIPVLAAAAEIRDLQGVVTVSTIPTVPPYGLSVYELADQLESLGVGVPGSIEMIKSWENEFHAIDPSLSVQSLSTIPWLIIQGGDDNAIDANDLRKLVEDVAGHGELHFISAGGESLRADPRLLALVVGWIARIDE